MNDPISSGQFREADQPDLDHLFDHLKAWCRIWRLPRLPTCLRIEFSARLRSSLGRCDLRRSLIRLNGILLLPANRNLLFETLCHEAAHVAAHLLHGTRIRAHGPEWRLLMKRAGYEPRRAVSSHAIEGLPPPRAKRRIYAYHCPVCQRHYRVNGKSSRYRCRACVEAGRPGRLDCVAGSLSN